MQKNKLQFILVLTIAVVLSTSAFSVGGIDDETFPPMDELHVGSGQTYSTIQDAIDAAFDGDTIFVHNGTYNEMVHISEFNGLTLQGEGADCTIIDSNGIFMGNGAINLMNSENVSISGFNITGGFGEENYGISLMASAEMLGKGECSNNEIFHNIIYSNGEGIHIEADSGGMDPFQDAHCRYNTIYENDFIENGYGGVSLWAEGTDYNSIYNNNFIGNQIYEGGTDPQGEYANCGLNNDWDAGYPTGGNYYDDFDEPSEGAYDSYSGVSQDASGSDGIVDLGDPAGGLNPYILFDYGGGPLSYDVDNYPLIDYYDWQHDEPNWEEIHKMHYPQPPDPNGWDVNLGQSEYYDNIILADDWNCSESGNVTDIYFWISWENDILTEINEIYLSIYSDNPMGSGGYSEPDALLWTYPFSPSDFTISDAYEGDQGWLDPYPSGHYFEEHNHLFYYLVSIENITSPFYQNNGTIYWLAIDIDYGSFDPMEKVGWKTSTEHWNDEAVYGLDSGEEGEIDPMAISWFNLSDPIEGTPIDFAFVIGGETGEEEDEPPVDYDHKMHYPQPPDPYGWDVDFYQHWLADDWQCSETGTIDDIMFWVSWQDDINETIPWINVSIWSDEPYGPFGYSEPLEELWQRNFSSSEFEVTFDGAGMQGFYAPDIPQYWEDNHEEYYLVNISDIEEPFMQENDTIYWLMIDMPLFVETGPMEDAYVGWKTSTEHWNDEAVWGFPSGESPMMGEWYNLSDPVTGEPLDFAFVVNGEPFIEYTEYFVDDDFDAGTPGWHVTHWDSIQEAVDNCSGEYYTINIYSGNYNENVVVNNNYITLQGNYTTTRPNVAGVLSDEPTIFFYGDNCIMSGLDISNLAGESLAYSAVELDTADYFEMFNCYIHDCAWGLVEADSIMLDIHDNEFYDSGSYAMYFGADFSRDEQDEIYNNTCWGAGVDSTAVGISIGGYISNTTVRNNYIHNCTSNGIQLGLRSVDNYIYENQVENCGGDGVELGYECARNWVYHNNFISNPPATHPTIFENYWNLTYPGCGNYYSGHGTQDIYSGPNQDIPGADGICDGNSPDPYTIRGPDNIDSYPFFNPFNGTLPTPPASQPPTVIDGSPNGTLTNTTPTLEVTLDDNETDLLNVSFYWSNHTLIGYDEGYTSASLSISPTILAHDTSYGWYVNVTDGNNTVTASFNFDTCRSYDLVPDGVINYLDVSMLVSHYLDSVDPPGSEQWDINGDGVVNYLDISTLVAHYSESY